MIDKKTEALKLALEALELHGQQYPHMVKGYCLDAITAIREALAEQETVLPGGGHVPAVPVAVYGYCPECGGAGVMRERRPNGDDKCTNGHKYPSSKALAEQPAQQTCLVANEPCKHDSWCSEVYCQEHCKFVEQPAREWNAGVPSLYPEPEQGVSIKVEYEQPEFFTHCVDQPYDWSEWVCPDPKGYLMKCCDCGLVHEAQFGVVRYKSETESEDCDMVDDPNLQAVFRMRRSEQWSPEDTAHRAGGLPMAEQPAQQQEPVAWTDLLKKADEIVRGKIVWKRFIDGTPLANDIAVWMADFAQQNTSPPASKPWVGLSTDEIYDMYNEPRSDAEMVEFAHAIEAKLKEKNHGTR